MAPAAVIGGFGVWGLGFRARLAVIKSGFKRAGFESSSLLGHTLLAEEPPGDEASPLQKGMESGALPSGWLLSVANSP